MVLAASGQEFVPEAEVEEAGEWPSKRHQWIRERSQRACDWSQRGERQCIGRHRSLDVLKNFAKRLILILNQITVSPCSI
jgi:hypothetical protein